MSSANDQLQLTIHLRDINAGMIKAWKKAFKDEKGEHLDHVIGMTPIGKLFLEALMYKKLVLGLALGCTGVSYRLHQG